MESRRKLFIQFLIIMALDVTMIGLILKNINFDEDRELAIYEYLAEENRDSFPELYENYSLYIDNIAECITSCTEERNILQDYAFYNTLLHNGFISLGEYEYSHTMFEVNDLRGATTAVGQGVCANNAFNMCDVFNSLGYEAKVVVGKHYSSNNEKPEQSNHAVVYVKDGNEEYLLDPTNKTIFLRRGYMEFCDMNSSDEHFVYFEPELHYANVVYGEINCYQLLLMGDNQFKNRLDISKKYREYRETAEEYMTYFDQYEQDNLIGQERKMLTLFIDYVINQSNNK